MIFLWTRCQLLMDRFPSWFILILQCFCRELKMSAVASSLKQEVSDMQKHIEGESVRSIQWSYKASWNLTSFCCLTRRKFHYSNCEDASFLHFSSSLIHPTLWLMLPFRSSKTYKSSSMADRRRGQALRGGQPATTRRPQRSTRRK